MLSPVPSDEPYKNLAPKSSVVEKNHPTILNFHDYQKNHDAIYNDLTLRKLLKTPKPKRPRNDCGVSEYAKDWGPIRAHELLQRRLDPYHGFFRYR
jgi:hypothetical protein